jgi:cobalt-zinc-cadmium efflux system outer membrane protein
MRIHSSGGALFVLAFAATALAQDLKELTAEALRNNPEILAAQKRYEATRQRPRQESSLPDPTLSLGYNSNGNPLPGAGLGTQPTSNIGFSVTQDFPYPGKLRLRGQISAKEADAELEQYRAVERDVLFRLTQAFHRLHHSYAAMEVLDRNHALLQVLLRTIENRYAVGKAAQEEAFKTQTQLTILETQRIQVERDRHAREAEIDSLLNRPAGTPIPRPADQHHHEIALSLEQMQTQARAAIRR